MFLSSILIATCKLLRRLEQPIIIETVASGGNLLVNKIFDVGNAHGIHYCEEATANLIPPDVLNDCGVAVYMMKEGHAATGENQCILVSNSKFIGGPDRQYLFRATRVNNLWWISEAKVLDICCRHGFSEETMYLIQSKVQREKSLATRGFAKL